MSAKSQRAPDLEERKAEVLRSVIREHVLTGEPVGSQLLARRLRVGLSAASIRALMAELEEDGLLSQPHRSAGRVPTDKAYRVFVDQMLGRPRMTASAARAIDDALDRNRGDFPVILTEASRQLSHFSNQVGLVLAPQIGRIIVDHLEFVRLDDRRVVAIMVARSGVVSNRILEVAEPLDQVELDRIGRYLTEEFGGHTVPEMRALLHDRVVEDRATYDRMVARGVELGRRTLAHGAIEEDVFVEGASNLLESPEFANPEVARELFRALEDKRILIDLLGRVLGGEGVQVVIGGEHALAGLSGCSLVASSYGVGGRVIGTVGVVGPKRMEYARAVALVDHLARRLSHILTAGED